MSYITTKRVFGCYLLQGGRVDRINEIVIVTPPKSENPFMNTTPGSLLWNSKVCERNQLEEPVLHIDGMKLHSSWLENEIFCQPWSPTEDLLDIPEEEGKEIITNKYITSMTPTVLDLLMKNPCEVMVVTGASYKWSPFKSDFTSFHILGTPKTLTGISSWFMIEGEITVRYIVRMDNGSYKIIKMVALCVTKINRRLISPQVIDT